MKKEKNESRYSIELVFETSKERNQFLKKINQQLAESDYNIVITTDDFAKGEICGDDCCFCDDRNDVIEDTITAIRKACGSIASASDLLGITPSAIYKRLKRNGLSIDDVLNYSNCIDDDLKELDAETATRTALKVNGGNVQKAAEYLGMTDSAVYKRIKKYGIER